MLNPFKSETKTLPVFMLAGIFLLVGVIIRVGASLYMFIDGYSLDRRPASAEPLRVERPKAPLIIERTDDDLQGNVFKDMHTKYPGYQKKSQQLVKQDVAYFSYNPAQGDINAPVQVVIFSDSGCASCRSAVNHFLKSIEGERNNILLVYKFMPVDDKNSSGGIFDQVAWRANVFDAYQKEILAVNGPLTTDDYLESLERVGVDLSWQQKIMREAMTDIVEVNQKDVEQARRLGLYKRGRVPVFFINGYRLGQAYLPEQDAAAYIQRLAIKQDIIADVSHETTSDTP